MKITTKMSKTGGERIIFQRVPGALQTTDAAMRSSVSENSAISHEPRVMPGEAELRNRVEGLDTFLGGFRC